MKDEDDTIYCAVCSEPADRDFCEDCEREQELAEYDAMLFDVTPVEATN